IHLHEPVQSDGALHASVLYDSACDLPTRHSFPTRRSSDLRSAVENTFPWASVLSEMVPPPSSAPCSRKFRAWRLGSSYRSTGPEIMPLKCRATRAAVTCCTRIG